ncbi:hypothetical protein ACOMHN_054094 [Nucella lapillus]
MRNAVWGIFFHKGSSDENPVHNFCDVAWCPYKQAQRDGTQYSHKTDKKHTYLPAAVMEKIKPIWKDLAKTELLIKCMRGYTQNQNESLNSLIWKFCPKSKNHGLTSVEIGVSEAVSVFNNGARSLMEVLKEMQIRSGEFCCQFCEKTDLFRVKNAERQILLATKEVRRARRLKRLGADEQQTAREGNPYMAGGY